MNVIVNGGSFSIDIILLGDFNMSPGSPCELSVSTISMSNTSTQRRYESLAHEFLHSSHSVVCCSYCLPLLVDVKLFSKLLA